MSCWQNKITNCCTSTGVVHHTYFKKCACGKLVEHEAIARISAVKNICSHHYNCPRYQRPLVSDKSTSNYDEKPAFPGSNQSINKEPGVVESRKSLPKKTSDNQSKKSSQQSIRSFRQSLSTHVSTTAYPKAVQKANSFVPVPKVASSLASIKEQIQPLVTPVSTTSEFECISDLLTETKSDPISLSTSESEEKEIYSVTESTLQIPKQIKKASEPRKLRSKSRSSKRNSKYLRGSKKYSPKSSITASKKSPVSSKNTADVIAPLTVESLIRRVLQPIDDPEIPAEEAETIRSTVETPKRISSEQTQTTIPAEILSELVSEEETQTVVPTIVAEEKPVTSKEIVSEETSTHTVLPQESVPKKSLTTVGTVEILSEKTSIPLPVVLPQESVPEKTLSLGFIPADVLPIPIDTKCENIVVETILQSKSNISSNTKESSRPTRKSTSLASVPRKPSIVKNLQVAKSEQVQKPPPEEPYVEHPWSKVTVVSTRENISDSVPKPTPPAPIAETPKAVAMADIAYNTESNMERRTTVDASQNTVKQSVTIVPMCTKCGRQGQIEPTREYSNVPAPTQLSKIEVIHMDIPKVETYDAEVIPVEPAVKAKPQHNSGCCICKRNSTKAPVAKPIAEPHKKVSCCPSCGRPDNKEVPKPREYARNTTIEPKKEERKDIAPYRKPSGCCQGTCGRPDMYEKRKSPEPVQDPPKEIIVQPIVQAEAPPEPPKPEPSTVLVKDKYEVLGHSRNICCMTRCDERPPTVYMPGEIPVNVRKFLDVNEQDLEKPVKRTASTEHKSKTSCIKRKSESRTVLSGICPNCGILLDGSHVTSTPNIASKTYATPYPAEEIMPSKETLEEPTVIKRHAPSLIIETSDVTADVAPVLKMSQDCGCQCEMTGRYDTQQEEPVKQNAAEPWETTRGAQDTALPVKRKISKTTCCAPKSNDRKLVAKRSPPLPPPTRKELRDCGCNCGNTFVETVQSSPVPFMPIIVEPAPSSDNPTGVTQISSSLPNATFDCGCNCNVTSKKQSREYMDQNRIEASTWTRKSGKQSENKKSTPNHKVGCCTTKSKTTHLKEPANTQSSYSNYSTDCSCQCLQADTNREPSPRDSGVTKLNSPYTRFSCSCASTGTGMCNCHACTGFDCDPTSPVISAPQSRMTSGWQVDVHQPVMVPAPHFFGNQCGCTCIETGINTSYVQINNSRSKAGMRKKKSKGSACVIQ